MRNKIIIGVIYTLLVSVTTYFLTLHYTKVSLPQNVTKTVAVEKNINKVQEKTTTKIDKLGNHVVVTEKITDKSIENITDKSIEKNTNISNTNTGMIWTYSEDRKFFPRCDL
jgi:predicted PurR-regulated permease PerM